MVNPTPIRVHPTATDPYLLWALARGLETRKRELAVPILLELKIPVASLKPNQLAEHALSIPSFYSNPEEKAFAESRYCSALAPWAFIESPPDWVNRLVLALPRTADVYQLFQNDKENGGRPAPPILAVIDDGLDFLNPRYIQNGNTRFIAVWDQNRGTTHHNADIRKHLQFGHSLEAYRRFFQYPLGKRTHGSAVLQMASKQYSIAGVADHHSWPLLAVQLPQSTVNDASGGSLGAWALDAMRFVFDQARALSGEGRPTPPVVINLSMGADAGAHDGTSIFEEAMDELLALREVNTAIVLPAGNAHDQQGHVSCNIPANQTLTVDWHVPSQDATDSFLELWSEAGSNLSISVTPPQGTTLPAVGPGQQVTLASGAGNGVAVLLANMGVNTLSKHRHMALLALAPTQGPTSSCAQSGRYRIAIHNQSGAACPVQLWLERDGTVYGHDSGGKRGQLVKDPNCPLQTGSNDNTLSSIANGKHTIVVGATQQHRDPLDQTQAATYSGRSATQPQVLAQGDEGPQNSLRGLPVQETVGQDGFRIGGTSLAAALASRWLMAYLTSSTSPVPHAEIASDLRKAAQGQGGIRHPNPPDWTQKI